MAQRQVDDANVVVLHELDCEVEPGDHVGGQALTEFVQYADGNRLGARCDAKVSPLAVAALSDDRAGDVVAVAEAIKRAPSMRPDQTIVVNLSGRGDKDLDTVIQALGYK